MLHTSYVNTA
ncbi:hypothetical protein SAMN02910263_03677 [Butyrivibrio sp. INlla16]|nr:hypothetical protein SAMN02910263_03677 [Butyrivibrio sp. INlla16]